jgi:hypothetical protein
MLTITVVTNLQIFEIKFSQIGISDLRLSEIKISKISEIKISLNSNENQLRNHFLQLLS